MLLYFMRAVAHCAVVEFAWLDKMSPAGCGCVCVAGGREGGGQAPLAGGGVAHLQRHDEAVLKAEHTWKEVNVLISVTIH